MMPPQLQTAYRPKRYSPRQVIEEMNCLDARWLARKRLFPKDYSTRRHGMRVFNPAVDWLTIGPRAAELNTHSHGQRQIISIIWLPIPWRLCNVPCQPSSVPAAAITLSSCSITKAYFAGCYRCIGVPYAAQQRSTERPLTPTSRSPTPVPQQPARRYQNASKPASCPGESMLASSIACRSSKQASSRRQKPITRKLSHKVLRPLTAYNSERYALD